MKNWLRKKVRSFLVGQEPAAWYTDWAGGSSASGIVVTATTAMNLSSIYGCAQILSQDIGALPLKLYKKVAEGKVEATDHALYRVLHSIANPEMTSFTWRGVVMTHIALHNQHISEIQRNKGGEVIALWPIPPERVRVLRAKSDNRLLYEVTYETGKTILEALEVLHIKGLSMDGIMGLDRIGLAKDNIGLGLAQQRSANKFFANGQRPSGVLENAGLLDEEAVKRMRASWDEIHSGVDNAHRIAILEQGTKFNILSIDPEKAQLLESRVFSVEEVARIFRMPLHKIQSMKASTNNNIEHQGLEYVIDTLMPWCVNLEAEFFIRLLTESEQKIYFPKFNLAGQLRGDAASRAEYFKTAINNGWMSADEVRELEDMNNLPDGIGKKYFMPVNMAEVSKEKFKAGSAAPAASA